MLDYIRDKWSGKLYAVVNDFEWFWKYLQCMNFIFTDNSYHTYMYADNTKLKLMNKIAICVIIFVNIM